MTSYDLPLFNRDGHAVCRGNLIRKYLARYKVGRRSLAACNLIPVRSLLSAHLSSNVTHNRNSFSTFVLGYVVLTLNLCMMLDLKFHQAVN